MELRNLVSYWFAMMQVLDFVRHIPEHVGDLIQNYGPWSYAILFAIIFAETGLVFMPFLPGDSLLFAAGIFANPPEGRAGFNVWILLTVLTIAPLIGDSVNYHVGKYLGPRIFKKENSKFFSKKHLEVTKKFFEKHGPAAVIIARWVPIIRTMAPFVAGMGTMDYRRFFLFSLLGAFIWVWGCVGAGYFLGGIPWVKENFEWAMLAIIVVTGAPPLFEAVKHYLAAKKEARLKAQSPVEPLTQEDVAG
jgi:membrane-associated protein